MVFSSPIFLFRFLPIVLILYLVIAHRHLRNPVLLAASLLFYAWGETWFVLVMLVSIAANYLFGIWVDRTRGRPSGRWAVACSVVFNLGLLGTFKYANFLVDNINHILSVVGVPTIHLSQIHLPIGISFFTFQAMSYVIDVYRGDAKAQKNPLNVALYISLFPQLIAGPIVRYRDIAGQIVKRVVTREGFATGVRRFITGLGKKVLIANLLAVPADKIFSIPDAQLTPGLAWLGVICFMLQIYFDFSGYSDMAIGLGRILGFRFLENFNYPYIARSVRDFWRRWHISLTTWLRDYLYIPLGGNRASAARTYINLVTVFLLCGLWHGAQWTFVVWGLYHGLFLVVERTGFGRWLKTGRAPVGHLYTLAVVTVGWALFRAETLSQAGAFVSAMFGLAAGTGQEHSVAMYLNTEVILALVAGVLFSAPVIRYLAGLRERYLTSRAGSVTAVAEALLCFLGIAINLFIVLLSASYLAAGTYNPFIYFRF